MPTIYEQIGETLRQLRTEAKMSQHDLAKKLDVAPNTVSRWETGTYKVTPEDLDKLSRQFKVSITVFFPHLAHDQGRVAALASATGGLGKREFEEVVRYAEFRKVRQMMDESKKTKK